MTGLNLMALSADENIRTDGCGGLRGGGQQPDQLRRSERIVSARDTLGLRLSPAGGAAVILEPADR